MYQTLNINKFIIFLIKLKKLSNSKKKNFSFENNIFENNIFIKISKKSFLKNII